jgi:hypothetical protein
VHEIKRMKSGPENFHVLWYQSGAEDRIYKTEVWLPVGKELMYIMTATSLTKLERSQIKDYLWSAFRQIPDLDVELASYRSRGTMSRTIDNYLA